MKLFGKALITSLLALGPLSAFAEEKSSETQQETPEYNFWDHMVFVPQVTNGPKMGFSAGGMGAYLHKFDAKSPYSMLAASGKYSNTQSWVGNFVGRAFWDENDKRAIFATSHGSIKNEYENFQGTGQHVDLNQDLTFVWISVAKQVGDTPWYLGFYPYMFINDPVGKDIEDKQILQQYGFEKTKNISMGFSIQYDTLDLKWNPSTGNVMEFGFSMFDPLWGSDETFEEYNFKYGHYFKMFDRDVLALHQTLLFMPDSPESYQATFRNFRAYTAGEINAEYMSASQIEYRWNFKKRWTAAAFTGAGFLVDKASELGHTDNWYPMAGAGIRYLLKPKSGLIIRLEYAQGKEGASAVYLQAGQPF